MSAGFEYTASGRSLRAVLAVAGAWAVLAWLYLGLSAAWWIVAPLSLTTLPALRDLWRNPQAGMRLDDETISWHSGRRHASVALTDVDRVRLDRRMDGSVRVTVVLTSGKRLRLPMESLPHHQALESTLTAHGLRCERNPFPLF